MRLSQALGTLGKLVTLDRKSWAVVKWKLDRGDSTLRVDYPLGPQSLVFDVGGYRGDWADAIASRYGCSIHVFEPLEPYAAEIRRRLGANPKVVINTTGLADKTSKQMISVDEEGSSVIKLGGQLAEIQLVDVAEYAAAHAILRIDLIKINIEGGEYALLDRMHEIGLLRECVDVQVQFHDFVPDAEALRRKARAILAATHDLTYDYPFIWENWHRKGT